MTDPLVPMSVGNVTRTLLAAGYSISEFTRFHGYVEYDCEREDRFGAVVRYRFVVADADEPPATANRPVVDRTLVLVARTGGTGHLSWAHFATTLGGPVPSWRALSSEYPHALRTASLNRTPDGWTGEGWEAFEVATADGLTFLFGRTAKRFGAKHRGQRLADFLAQTPDQRLLIGDAKSTKIGRYFLERPNLRPMLEYVALQRARQVGEMPLAGAIIVANDFGNSPQDARDICNEFIAESQLPLALLRVDALLHMIEAVRSAPELRQKVRWAKVFCVPGMIDTAIFDREMKGASTESWMRET